MAPAKRNRMQRHAKFFRRYKMAGIKAKNRMIKTCSPAQFKAFCELSKNITGGTFARNLKPKQKRRLCKAKRMFRTLEDPDISLADKREAVLTQEGGSVALGIAASAALPYIGRLATYLYNKIRGKGRRRKRRKRAGKRGRRQQRS